MKYRVYSTCILCNATTVISWQFWWHLNTCYRFVIALLLWRMASIQCFRCINIVVYITFFAYVVDDIKKHECISEVISVSFLLVIWVGVEMSLVNPKTRCSPPSYRFAAVRGVLFQKFPLKSLQFTWYFFTSQTRIGYWYVAIVACSDANGKVDHA